MSIRVLVVAGGEPEPPLAEPLGEFDLTVAADSGLDQARHLGIDVDVVVGDLDSVSDKALAEARRLGVPVEQHPRDKDATDLELAFQVAIEHEATEVLLVGGGGGRVDQSLATFSLLGGLARRVGDVGALVGGWRIRAVLPGRTWEATGLTGELVSLLPVGGDVTGVSSSGLIYPLSDLDLSWGESRGLSNRFAGGAARVEIGSGVLLIIRPPEGTHIP